MQLNDMVKRVLALNKNGKLCAAEVWNVLCDGIPATDVDSMLDSLSKTDQQNLVSLYHASPHSLTMSLDAGETRQHVIAWCERMTA